MEMENSALGVRVRLGDGLNILCIKCYGVIGVFWIAALDGYGKHAVIEVS